MEASITGAAALFFALGLFFSIDSNWSGAYAHCLGSFSVRVCHEGLKTSAPIGYWRDLVILIVTSSPIGLGTRVLSSFPCLPLRPPKYRVNTITHTHTHMQSYCSNVIVWTGTVSELLDLVHLSIQASAVRGCTESLRVAASVCACARGASCS